MRDNDRQTADWRLTHGTASSGLPRRTFLRGAGVALALPWLEAMAPRAFAGAKAAAAKPPVRMAFLFTPNGMIPSAWDPKEVGANFSLSPTLEPPRRCWPADWGKYPTSKGD